MFVRIFATLSALLIIACSGCSGHPGYNPEAITVEGTVKLRDKPLSGITLNLQPTKQGHPVTAKVENGKFKTTITPGTYCFFVTEGENPAALKEVPKEYLVADLESRDEVVVATDASTIEITMD